MRKILTYLLGIFVIWGGSWLVVDALWRMTESRFWTAALGSAYFFGLIGILYISHLDGYEMAMRQHEKDTESKITLEQYLKEREEGAQRLKNLPDDDERKIIALKAAAILEEFGKSMRDEEKKTRSPSA